MSSWPAGSYPPNARRSGSRSPARGGGYPSGMAYPDPGYMRDAYRHEWPYDRQWAEYDYGHRGRSRSPGDESRKRRRSMSPSERGRYEPRPRYGPEYDAPRGYGTHSPPRRGYSGGRRPPLDPNRADYPVSLKHYADWFRFTFPDEATKEDNADKIAENQAGDGSRPRNGIKAKWEQYKREFSCRQLQAMFDYHRKSPWFAEKYDPAPEFDNLRKRVRKEGWKGRLNAFLLGLENGTFDPDLTEPELQPTSPTQENPVNGDHTAERNGGHAADGDAKVEEDQSLAPDGAEDDNGDNDAPRTETNGKAESDHQRKFSGAEEVSVEAEGNQVMIRTIPPDIGRVKLETACSEIPGYVYLALGDPMQKRNYYRAGWLKFREDVDMPSVMSELSEIKIEGFKLHVTHNTRPFVNRVRYAPEVASKPDRMEHDLANCKALAAVLEDEAEKLRALKLPKKFAAAENDGDVPMPDANDTDEQRGTPDDGEEPEPGEKGSEAVERRIEKVMADMVEQGLVDASDEKAMHAKKVEVSLDLYLAYLRHAYHTCYYCAITTDHLEELQRKCLKHKRKPLTKLLLDELKAAEAAKAEQEDTEKIKGEDDAVPAEPVSPDEKPKEKEAVVSKEARDWKRNDERWLEWLDSKIALLINRNGVDPRDYGGKSYDEALSKTVQPFIKQEDDAKYRCKTCSKLFKATSFLEKHIANKHPEHVASLDELPYFNNFALDPHRIQPFAHPPPPSGNNQPLAPQAYGITGRASDEYGRGGEYYGYAQGYSYAQYPNSGSYYDAYYQHYGAPPAYAYQSRREDTRAMPLSHRITGYAPGYDGPGELPAIHLAAGLPPKPAVTLEPARKGNKLPPPTDAKEDPRASRGKRLDYHDMDQVAEGDVELSY